MKRNRNKILALLLTALLALSLLPLTAFAQEKADADGRGEQREPVATGYIRGEIHGASAISNAYRNGDMETYYRLLGVNPTRDTLPAKYDSRDYNYITSVKNQNPYGSCWAHAAMASVESYMISHNVPVGMGDAATTSLNLSETQHAFFTYSAAYDAEGMTVGDNSISQDSCLDQGGNGEFSGYTLMHWTGAADESVNALRYSNAAQVNSSGLGSEYAYEYNVSHVQNTVWIPGTSVEAIKQAIMEFGAGNISYYEDNDYNSYICTIDTTSTSSPSHKWANHAITVVGWDDSIATSKFSPNKPSKPGAWICKNSWGTGYFDNGYCYISYEDTTMNSDYIYFYDAEPIDNYDHNYQYDGSSNAVTYGRGNRTGFPNDTKVANIFTAKSAEILRAVSFCNWDEALTYTVEVYKNPEAGNPSSGTLVASETGTLDFAGYYTIPLSSPVTLAMGDKFSVVVNQHCPVADTDGTYIHTPYDATYNDSSVVSWCRWVHVDHGDTSYYQEPGAAWTDCPDNGDYRIKAYTDDVTFVVNAIPNDPALGSVSVNGTVITTEPAEGYYVADYEVVEGTATAVINRNVINVSPETDCTIRVIFAPKPTYTVTYMSSGVPQGSVSAQIYDLITLPASVTTSAEGWTFSGWTEGEVEETDVMPAYFEPGAAYTVTGNVTLYALFTREEGSGTVSYRLVSQAPADWAGNYVITAGTNESMYLFKGVTPTSDGADIESTNNAASFSAAGVTLADSTTLANVGSDYVFTFTSLGTGYYSLRSVATEAYIGVTSNSYLGGYFNYKADYCDWMPGVGSNASGMKSAQYGYYPYFSFASYGGATFWTSSYVNENIRFWKETVDITVYYNTNPTDEVHTHTLTHVAAVEPGCETEGNIEYWVCSGCGKYFADEEGNTEISAEDTIIPATGHAWGEPAYAWAADNSSVTATAVCAHDATHVLTETAETTYAVTVEPGCETEGTGIYTAVFTNELFAEQTKAVTIPAAGHEWNAPVWTWTETEDGFTATATFTCAHDAAHVQTLPAEVTCTEAADGSLVYTAAVTGPDGEQYTDEKTVERFTVTFANYDGTVLQTGYYKAGEMPVYEGETPVKEDALYHHYTYTGWDKEIAAVTGDTVYTAVYDDQLYALVKGMSLELEGKLGIRLRAGVPEEAAKAVLEFGGEFPETIETELVRDAAHGYNSEADEFTLIYGKIAAKEMTCPLTLKIYDAEGTELPLEQSTMIGTVDGTVYTTCLADWAAYAAENASAENTVNLAKSILNYGGAAQAYFKFNTENPANPLGYLADETADVTADSALDRVIPANAKSKLGFLSMALNLEGDTELQIKFSKKVTAVCNGKALTVKKTGSMYVVSIPGIAAVDLDEMYSVQVTSGSSTMTFKAAALSWCNAALGASQNENLITLCKALYVYNKMAEIYFNKVD